MTKTYFSKRIYKNTLPQDIVDTIQKSLLTFNQAKRYAYSLILREKRTSKKYEKSVHIMVKSKYGINDYIANSAAQEAGALIRSQEELKKQYIKDTEEQIKKRLKKIKELEKQLKNKNKMLDSLIKGKFKAYQGANENKSDNFYYIRHKYRTEIHYDAY